MNPVKQQYKLYAINPNTSSRDVAIAGKNLMVTIQSKNGRNRVKVTTINVAIAQNFIIFPLFVAPRS